MGEKIPSGSFVDSQGYLVLTMQRGHPLADSHHKVLAHRKILFDKIGPGEHPCHWCGKLLEWGGRYGICGDHVDNDLTNNDPDNLVPSCLSCNSKRQVHARVPLTECVHGHAFTDDNVYRDPRGRRHCKKCRSRRMRELKARRRHGRQGAISADAA